jgi:hypothetical protein
MIVAGPNARKDYHYNETELFYQLEGSIKVIIQEDGIRKEMELNAGDMYLHPAKFHILLFVLRVLALLLNANVLLKAMLMDCGSVITVTINYTMFLNSISKRFLASF